MVPKRTYLDDDVSCVLLRGQRNGLTQERWDGRHCLSPTHCIIRFCNEYADRVLLEGAVEEKSRQEEVGASRPPVT